MRDLITVCYTIYYLHNVNILCALRHAKKNLRWYYDSMNTKPLELLIPPAAILLIVILLMWLLRVFFPSLTLDFTTNLIVIYLVGLIGLGISGAGGISFMQARTTLNPKKPGNASRLVTSGIYRFTRNPMYLGLQIMLIAWGMFLGNIVSLLFSLAFGLYIHRYQILPEERFLEEKFGAEFIAYKSQVRPWL